MLRQKISANSYSTGKTDSISLLCST